MIELHFGSSLDADVADVWSFVSMMKGVNFELHPFIHMTSPPDQRTLPATITPGQVIFRSWLLLFCMIPIDRHALALAQIDDGAGFVEESSTWIQRRWRHERRLTTNQDHRCLITDRLVIEPRVRFARPLVASIARQFFLHRHRRLQRRFGTVRC